MAAGNMILSCRLAASEFIFFSAHDTMLRDEFLRYGSTRPIVPAAVTMFRCVFLVVTIPHREERIWQAIARPTSIRGTHHHGAWIYAPLLPPSCFSPLLHHAYVPQLGRRISHRRKKPPAPGEQPPSPPPQPSSGHGMCTRTHSASS
jgi:hypothetical protein